MSQLLSSVVSTVTARSESHTAISASGKFALQAAKTKPANNLTVEINKNIGVHLMIIVSGLITINSDNFGPMLENLRALCEPSRAEPGCRFYRMAVEDEEKGRVLAIEGWDNMEALNKHLALPSIIKLQSDFEGKYTADVEIYEVSGTHNFG